MCYNNSLNNGNLNFDYIANEGLYYELKVGADTVRKKCKSEIINLGSALSIDVSSVYSAFNELTIDNFIVSVTSISGSASGNAYKQNVSMSGQSTISKSYDNTTGVLTISGQSASMDDWTIDGNRIFGGVYCSVKTYLIV